MVYCVAVNCRSENHQTASGEKVSFHCFPKDKKLRKIWEQKVNRKNWSVDKCSRRAAVLCGLHFEPDLFTINPVLAKSVGYQPRSLTLKPGSIPTIFDRGASQECDEPPVPKKRRYCERRDREELLETLTKPNEVPVVDVASDDHLVVEAPMQADASDRGESDTDSPPPTPYRLMHPFTYAPTPIIKEPPQKMDKKIGCKPEMKTKSTQTTATETPSLKTPLPVASQSLPTPSVPEPSTMPVPHPAQHSFTLPPPVNNSCNCCCTCQDDTAYSPQKVAHTTRSGRKTWIRTVSFDDAESATNPDEDFCPDEVDEDPDSEDEDLGDTACSEEPSSNPKAERKYIVFETKLLELLRHCRLCGAKAKVESSKTWGTMLQCFISCERGHSTQWCSQPVHQKLAWGNLLLASSIFFFALNSSKVIRALKSMSVTTMSLRTYHYIQQAYLVPSVCRVWECRQDALLEERQTRPVKLGGDARCCTPGHTATYSSYTLMDMESNRVLDIQLVMVTETANSYAMELEGLQRGIAKLENSKIVISDLVTDRHSSVKKYMKKRPDIKHWFDVWHIAKGIQKKLEALSKKRRDLNVIKLWSRSISNHVYWVASSSNGDVELVKQKWMSILNHVCNIHEGHGDLFPVCQHDEMGPDDREWFRSDSRQFRELRGIVMQKLLLQDIGQVSPHVQTSSLEAFHSLICQFAPKFFRFSYHTMKARLLLAALHYNENGDRDVVLDEDGQPKMRMEFPKAKKGQPTVKFVKEESTFDYIDDLWRQVVVYRLQYPSYKKAVNALAKDPAPPTVTSLYPPQEKAAIVASYRSRFNKPGNPAPM